MGGQKKRALLAQLGPKTVSDLAGWKYPKWAEAVCCLAPVGAAGALDVSNKANMMNINKALDKEHEGSSLAELLEAPISALEGISEKQAQIFNAIGLKTIKDLGTWKYFNW